MTLQERAQRWEREQIRLGGLEFWAERAGWPLCLPGKTFLLDAIDIEGKRRFGRQWTGSEQAEQFKPILIEGTVAAGGLDEVYAADLLAQYRPGSGRVLISTTDGDLHKNPLTDDEWRAAFAIFRDVIAPTRIPGSQRLNAVIDDMIVRLINGEIRAYARSIRGVGALNPIPPELWTEDIVFGRFLFGLFNRCPVLERTTILLSPKQLKAPLRLPEGEWPEFVFLDAEAVASNVLPLNAEADASAVNAPAKAPPKVGNIKTRQERDAQDTVARNIFRDMQDGVGRVTRRPYERRCKESGVKSTVARHVFDELSKERAG